MTHHENDTTIERVMETLLKMAWTMALKTKQSKPALEKSLEKGNRSERTLKLALAEMYIHRVAAQSGLLF